MPPRDEITRLGLSIKHELAGGHQSRMLRVIDENDPGSRELVLKLIHAPSAGEHTVARLSARDHAARYDDRVVPLVALAGRKINRVGDCYAVASPWIDGRFLDISMRSDVERMGRALARLHQSLRLVKPKLPSVPALRAVEPIAGLEENQQLLHGDFWSSNLLLDADGMLWIFDFDDCGYGPVEFELGNTLFMALFDTSPSLSQPSEQYFQFRKWLLGAYRASAEHPISDALVDLGLQTRSSALRYWLRHLDEAPVGIRTASEAWHTHLRAFAGAVQL